MLCKYEGSQCGYYERVLLYVYGRLENIIEDMNKLIVRKALFSYKNTDSCYSQAQSIINIIEKKEKTENLKAAIDDIVLSFSIEEQKLLEYKFFRRKNKFDFSDFDYLSRNYFRKQSQLLKKFSKILKIKGITKDKFYSEFGGYDFVVDVMFKVKRDDYIKADKIFRRDKKNGEKHLNLKFAV